MEMSGQLHAPAALHQGKSPWYPLDRRLGGPQSRSGRGGEEKNSQPLPGLEPPIIQPLDQCYTTELSRLISSVNENAYEDVSKSFRTESITKSTTTNTRWETTQRVMRVCVCVCARACLENVVALSMQTIQLCHMPNRNLLVTGINWQNNSVCIWTSCFYTTTVCNFFIFFIVERLQVYNRRLQWLQKQ
jgi:hypothetical protein